MSILSGFTVAAGLCLGAPLVAALRDLALLGDAGSVFTARRLTLLARGIQIALAASAVAQLLALPLVVGLVRPPGSRSRAVAVWVALTTLLVPPYVYAYAWSLPLLPEGLPTAAQLSAPWPGFLATYGRAVWCLACWLAPVSAIILACGWRASGRPAWLLAIPDARPLRALWSGGLGAMRVWLGLSMTAVTALALTEFSICHLSLVPTWNTEIFAELQVIAEPGRGLVLAWPLVAIVAALAFVWWLQRVRLALLLDDLALLSRDVADSGASTRGGARAPIFVALGAAVLLIPWGLLLWNLRDIAALVHVWRVFPHAWPDGLRCAAGATLLSLLLALGVDLLRCAPQYVGRGAGRLARGAAALTTVLAAVLALAPPALVGDAFLAAYARVYWISEHAWIVSLVGAARFAIIPIALLGIAGRVRTATLTPLALADRATLSHFYWRVRFPLVWGALALGATLAGVLSLTEIAAAQMVTPPGVKSLAVTLLNQIHFGRSDSVIAMCLYTLALVGVLSAIVGSFGGAGRAKPPTGPSQPAASRRLPV